MGGGGRDPGLPGFIELGGLLVGMSALTLPFVADIRWDNLQSVKQFRVVATSEAPAPNRIDTTSTITKRSTDVCAVFSSLAPLHLSDPFMAPLLSARISAFLHWPHRRRRLLCPEMVVRLSSPSVTVCL